MADINNPSIHTSEEYGKHTRKYTKLLKNYISHTKSANKIKNDYKIIFFWIIIAIMNALTLAFLISLCSVLFIIIYLSISKKPIPMESIIGLMTTVVSSFVTMLVSLFKLPKIIAKYLFNPEEDKNMATVIGHIQTYDIGMYKIDKELEKESMKKILNNQAGDQEEATAVDETEEIIGNPSDMANETNPLQETN